MQKLLLSLLLFVLPSSAWGVTCHVIGPSSTGTGSGNDFNNIKGITSQSTTGWVRGDTYYFVAGNYPTSLSMNTANSGTTVITMLRATNADHGTSCSPSVAAGYNDSTMGQPAGTAKFPSMSTSTRFWTIDGAYHPLPWITNGNTTGGYGFFIDISVNNTCTNCWLFSISNSEDGNFIIVRNMEMLGHGQAGINNPNCTPSGGGSGCRVDDFFRAVFSGTDLTFQYLYLHDSSSTFLKARGYANITWDHVWMARNYSTPANHSEPLSLQTANGLTVSYSVFQDTSGTGAIVWLNAGSPTTSTNTNIYGNLFYMTPTFVGGGFGNGILSCINGNGINGMHFYNNTIANVQASLSSGLQFGTDSSNCGLGVTNADSRNNLWFNNVPANVSAAVSTSNNSYLGTTTNDAGTSTIIVASPSNPFVSTSSLVASDFQLTTNTNITPWFNTNATVPGNAVDILGTTRALSRGMYELISSSLPVLSFSPNPVAFGNQNVGTTSGQLTVTVSNVGTATEVLATPYFTITGTNASNFANAGTGTCVNGASIPVSGSCTVKLTFTPSASGSRSATLTIQGTAFGTVSLTGTGIQPVISLSPSPAAFGNQAVGTTSSALTVTISNTGTANEVLSTPFFTISGTNAGNFARSGGTCADGGTIATSGSCTILLTFTPSATGSRTATLAINGTVSATDSLTGTGTQAALSFSPSPAAFGNQNINTTSAPLTVTITNTGTASEILSTPYFTITGTNASEFTNAGTGTCANGGTIAVSGSCTVNLTFTPTAAGARTASLNIAGSVNGLDSLTGTGVAPLASVAPTSIAFGNQTTGTTSGNHAVTLSNPGTATLSISSISLIGANASDFGTNGSTCGSTLAAGATCSLNVTFAPATVGAKTATLRFTTNAASSPDDVSLTGTGVAPGVPVLSFSPTSGAFGNQLQGTTSAPITFTVSNVGTASEVLATPFFTITGTNAGDFARTGGTCTNGATIAVSGSCTVTLTFTPSATGGRAASLNILGTANGSVALSGTGTLPVVSLSPSPGAFGNQLQGTTSGPLTITLSNTGTAGEVLATPYFSITGTNPTNFANTGAGTCANGATVAPSGSCTIVLTFTPSATGSRSATLNVFGTANATDSLTGTGVLPVVAISPSPIGFGNQAIGGTTAPVTVTVSNTGTSNEVLSSPFFTITGTDSADFARTGGTCANAGTIAPSGSCTVLLTFTPGASGNRSAVFTIVGTVNASANLLGTGTAPVVSLSTTSLAFGNQTVGTQSGNQAVTLTNTGNATLTISGINFTGANANQFGSNSSTCGGTLAASASCSLNVTFAPTSTGSKTASLTFTTNASSSPDNVSLTGTGTPVAVPSLSFSPSPVTFGPQLVATNSAPITVTVTNSGTANEVLASPYFVITGANATSFSNANLGSCINGTVILPTSSCTVTLVFTPSTTGSLSATLTIQGTVNGSVNLSGTGVAAGGVSLNPANINFGNQDNGTTSSPTAVVLTNTGSGTLAISSIALTGANAAEFGITANTCGLTLAANGTCTWNVVFSPQTTGSKSASVTVTTDAASSPDQLPLTGTGRVPNPPSVPAPAITIVTILPPGSVVISAPGSGVSPRNAIAGANGCSQDGINFQNPCRFSVSCGNCSKLTRAYWNGVQVSQTFSKGTVTALVPASLVPVPTVATSYQLALAN